MRVTNSMVFGNSLNNIWRNARHLNGIIQSIETTKRTQRPSDDPMLASRSLRYRTILSETEQFLRNSDQGMAWMDVTEASFHNILTGNTTEPSLMQRIYERLVVAAQTGTNTIEDQRAAIEYIRQQFEQLFRVEMNQTYMGRYVFSGFHTNQPPVLKNNWPGREFVIQQTFNAQDIERTRALERNFADPTQLPDKIDVNIIKLPFTNVNLTDGAGLPGTVPPIGFFAPDGTPLTAPDGSPLVIREFDSRTDMGAYRILDPADPDFADIHFIHDTGEIVISDRLRDSFPDGVVIRYIASDLQEGDLNPIVYFPSWELTPGVGDGYTHFNTAGQNIQLEISPNVYITINTHARNTLTDKMFADFRNLLQFVDSLQASDPQLLREHFSGPPHHLADDDLNNAVDYYLSRENAMFVSAIHDRLNNMLELHARHTGTAQRAHTGLGSRMARMEMVQIRLEEDENAYTTLLSENEDTDLEAAIMRRNSAQTAMQNALRAVAMTSQLSLADFINR